MAKRVISHANNNFLFFAYFGTDTCNKSLSYVTKVTKAVDIHTAIFVTIYEKLYQ